MSTTPLNPLSGMKFETKNVPSVYCNHASPSLSFNDIRVYLSEVVPNQLDVVTPTDPTTAEPVVEPRVCLVVSPEFAKGLGQALMTAAEKYEQLFGPLRIPPTQEELNLRLLPPTQPKA
jgi:hypothetical protein